MPSPDTVQRRAASARRGCHYSAQQSDRMCSTAENPSAARKASCRCSWPGPPAILSGRAIRGSNPPQQRTVKLPYVTVMSAKSRLSEPDSSDCTHKSWSRTRRVIGKAEHTLDGANPRFVVTSLKRTCAGYDARALYEDLYCARGEAENRIGEQFELFADRASSATMAANQLRMWFSAMAYVLVDTLRRVGLRHTQFADAAAQTIRLKLLRLG